MGTLQALLESQQEPEVELSRQFMTGMPAQVLNYMLDFPADIQAHLPQVKPEYFGEGVETLVFTFLVDYFEKHGVVPTRAALWDVVSKKLTMDDPYEESQAIIYRGSDPRETPYIKTSFTEWLKNRAYAALFTDATVAAHTQGDYTLIHKILDDAQTVGNSAASTQVPITQLLEFAVEYDWAIEGVLLKNQPCVVGGAAKTLKTSICVDMVVSLSTGTKFLGKYKAHKTKVLYYSGESGHNAIRNQVRAIMKQREIIPADLDGNLTFDFKLPRLTNAGDIAGMRQALIKGEYKVVVIDPLYLCLTADSNLNATNIFDMGKALSGIARVCGEAGVTLVLCHHFNRKGAAYARPTLNDLSMAGCAEFCRQHILLGRKKPYEANGIHELFVTMGREGGCDQLDLTINEGLPTDRTWEVTVEAGTSSGTTGRDKRDKKMQSKAEGVLTGIIEILKAGDQPTQHRIKDECGISGAVAKDLLQFMVEQGMVEMVDKGGRTLFYPAGFQPDSDK